MRGARALLLAVVAAVGASGAAAPGAADAAPTLLDGEGRGRVVWLVSWQHAGHIRPLCPIARELQERAWKVSIVVHEEAKPHVDAGLDVVSAGTLPWTWQEELEFRDMLWASSSAPPPNATNEELRLASEKRADASERYFFGSQRSLSRGLEAALDAGAAVDLIVADVSSPGAADVAEKRGVPFVVLSSWPVGPTLQAIADETAFRYPWLPSELFVFTQSADQQSLYDRVLRTMATTATPWFLEWAGFHAPRRKLREELGLPPAGLELMEPPRLKGGQRPLVLITTHWALDRSRPLPPHIMLVGPTENYSTRAAARPPLPVDVLAWMERVGSFVYVSFGTNVRPKPQQVEAMVEGMRRAEDLYFLWDYRDEMVGVMDKAMLPENILAAPRVDQLAVLASGRVSAFVSHCGLNSLHEAMHFGVPIMGMPFVADQLVSARLVVEAGAGVRLNTRGFDAEGFAEAVRDAATTASFRQAAARVGRLADTAGGARAAADAIEAVAEHGAAHLQMLVDGDLGDAAGRIWDVRLILSLPLVAVCVLLRWCVVSRSVAARDKVD